MRATSRLVWIPSWRYVLHVLSGGAVGTFCYWRGCRPCAAWRRLERERP